MSLARLSRQLRRDLKANPKKAATLALLAAVAVWFWLPLVVGENEENDSPTAAIPAPAATAATVPVAASSASHHRWQDLARSIEQDPRMRSVASSVHLLGGRNPFGPSPKEIDRLALEQKLAEEKKKQAAVEEQAKKTETAQPKPVTPEDAGLVLSSTISGGGLRMAMINGRGYAEGRVVEVNDLAFRLVTISSGSVILEREGKMFNLSIAANVGTNDKGQ